MERKRDPRKPRPRNVFLSDEQWAWAHAKAKAKNTTVSLVIREAVEAYRQESVRA